MTSLIYLIKTKVGTKTIVGTKKKLKMLLKVKAPYHYAILKCHISNNLVSE
jgi:hypothetical protein